VKPNKAMAWPTPRAGEKLMHDADSTGFLQHLSRMSAYMHGTTITIQGLL
jgi:hypothetical protein